ncbi:MAG: hypothetical protein WAT21_00185 [Saprospiraceae bacterium]
MKVISTKHLISNEAISILQQMINSSYSRLYLDQSQYISFDRSISSFEVYFPGNLTLINQNPKEQIGGVDFISKNELDAIESEIPILKITECKNDFSDGSGMHIWENKIVKIDIFCDVSSDIFDDLNSFDIIRKFVKSHKCKELEYLRQTDELILFTCADNTKLLLQATTGVNGSVVLHFDENHIDKILSNEHYTYSPKKNYIKRLTIK